MMKRRRLITSFVIVLTMSCSCTQSTVKTDSPLGLSDSVNYHLCREEFISVLKSTFEERGNPKHVGLELKVKARTCQDTLNHYLLGCLYPMHVDTLFKIWNIRPNDFYRDRYRYFCQTSKAEILTNPKSKEYPNRLFFRIDTLKHHVIEVKMYTDSGSKVIKFH